ncbi:MAG: hypothetical protein FJY95_11925 [Candidatus Handelsmanbacteria bacterium]|nr:hypothetical protein [Candidatus Handelsmanbacteria bacterium]
MKEEANLLDYVYVLVKWRRLIWVSVLAVALVTALVSLILPQEWKSSTTLVPPEEELDQVGLGMLLNSAMPFNLGGLGGQPASAEKLVTLLKSRRVLGAMVDRFGLVEGYGVPHREQAIEQLDEYIEEELGRDGTLKIEVRAASPELSAQLANALAQELDAVNREYKRRQARALREFLEIRVQVVRQELEEGGRAFQRFQEEYGLVDLEEQTAAAVEVVKNVVMAQVEQEVKLGVLRQQLAAGHEERWLVEAEVGELEKQLLGMTGDTSARTDTLAAGIQRQALGPQLRALPELGFQYTKLGLELKVKEEIIRFLGTKLEEAKYKEALNTPTLQVLDEATPPKYRSAPRRALMVVVAAACSLVLSAVLAFVFESLGQAGQRHQEQVAQIRGLLRRDQ